VDVGDAGLGLEQAANGGDFRFCHLRLRLSCERRLRGLRPVTSANCFIT
jgi:hypothetical protein